MFIMYTHTHTRMHTHVHTHARTHAHACTHTHAHTCTHMHTHAHAHTHTHMHTHAHTQVNVPSLSTAMLPSSEAWVQLGMRLGKFGSALLQTQPKTLAVTIHGDSVSGGYWVPSVLVGCLGERVNLVNAELVAKEKGISGTCSRESGGESGVTVQFEAEGGGVEVRGMVVGGVPLLTAVGGEEVGLFELRGKVVVCEGVKLVEAVQQLPGALQVSVSC